ncbi:MAG: metallophosphoesterase [Nanoarchaeota archaeon]
MQFQKNIQFINKAVHLKNEKILVISDIHIGYEEALNKQGIFIPRFQFKETIEDIKKILKETGKLDKIIILGDLKHEFGTISEQEWNETLDFLTILEKNTNEIILIKGNHDTILGPIANKKNIKIQDYYKLKEYFFCHGNKLFQEIFDKKIKYIFLGHLHPAVALKEESKIEKYKCFLVGKERGKTIILLPSFIPIIEGSDLIKENMKIFGKISINNFKVYAVEDKIYYLGKYKKFG